MAENREGGEGDGILGGGGGESSYSSSTGVIPSVSVDIQEVESRNVQTGWRLGKRMHTVPPQLLLRKPKQQYVYDPMTISIGPYHHGKRHLRQLEEFKSVTLKLFLSDSNEVEEMGKREFFYTMIYEQIDEIRNCYVGVSRDEYDDAALSEMLLRDASFIIYYMRVLTEDMTATLYLLRQLGISAGLVIGPDISMLENQIPYWIIKFLMCSRFGEAEWKELLRKYLSDVCYGDVDRLTTIPWEEEGGEGDPFHLLEATHWIIVKMEQECNNVTRSTRNFWRIPSWIFKISRYYYMCGRIRKRKGEIADSRILNRQMHSVTYLKEKGIHFRQSSRSLQDVRFESNTLYGKLLLPFRFVNEDDRVLYPNLIAFELSPNSTFDFTVTSYINLMASLIENPNDVNELREKGILVSGLPRDAEVVKLFQEIDTLGLHIDFFDNVKVSINEHCKKKSKTWIADLINTKFQSPWTIIALLAATVLLILTFLQTYYTIRAA